MAEFTPTEVHQGWAGIVHGGVIGLLLDEAVAYAAYFHGFKALTARVETRFRKVVEVGQKLRFTGEVIEEKRRLLRIRATAHLEDGTLAAEADATMYVVRDR
ncbi:MAG: PaaI family thioesterase [Armatimonadota bacterium]|nr:PaaI family thioesterase [Armatimonadota bacterium]MDR5702180.1 PaaI family thioesterase [Armatimonadota bacterium]MDR7433932.1 PaaI family thioesterase [Armatimonadota bacterium]